MQIVGEWFLCDDGISRPILRARVFDGAGLAITERLLVDSGADCTVLSAVLLGQLRLPHRAPSFSLSLTGISGTSSFVIIDTVLQFTRDDGGPATVRGNFAAFTDPKATDLSILGRDVLSHFDLILSQRRQAVLLLSGPHHYVVASS